MKARVFAWALVFVTVYTVYNYGHTPKNPWTVSGNPVLGAIPVAASGCKEKCL